VVRAAERVGLSPDEYLAWERVQPVRHEYFRGEVFAMAGGSDAVLDVDAIFAGMFELVGDE